MAFQTAVALGVEPTNVEWLSHLSTDEVVEAYRDVNQLDDDTHELRLFVEDFSTYCHTFPSAEALAKNDALLPLVAEDVDRLLREYSVAKQWAAVSLERLERTIQAATDGEFGITYDASGLIEGYDQHYGAMHDLPERGDVETAQRYAGALGLDIEGDHK